MRLASTWRPSSDTDGTAAERRAPCGLDAPAQCLPLRGLVRAHDLQPAPLVSANYRMKLTGRGHRSSRA
jgi:hypothetical protein